MERRIKSLVRWNALAMVVRANKIQEGIGGHISTFASAATLYEVAFNHFFQAQNRKRRPRLRLFSGPRRARNLCARLSRRPHSEREAGEFSPRVEARRWTEFLSAPVADAEFLGVSHGFDGIGADSGDLSRALHSLPGKSRAERIRPAAKYGRSWAMAKWTSPNLWARSRWLRARISIT